MRPTGALLLVLTFVLSSCDQMDQQPRYDSYEKSSLFADDMSLQAPPDGTVARGDLAREKELSERPEMSMALLQRGRERFGIYCAPCHDATGSGQGRIPSRGFPNPPSFHIERLRDADSRYFVDVITQGHGVMYSYADRIEPRDRWAIAAYIRALQLAENATAASLPPDDRQKLPGGGS